MSLRTEPLALAIILASALSPSFALAQESTPHTTKLPSITVSGAKAVDEPGAPLSATVIPRSEVEKKIGADLQAVVTQAPGVTLMPTSNKSKGISIRGMDPRYTLTIVDGRRQANSDMLTTHGGGKNYSLGWIPLSAIERVEVIRGPMSLRYGSGALGGVINIVTRWPDDVWQGTVQVGSKWLTQRRGLGGNGTNAAFYVAGPLGEGLSLRLNGDYVDTDPIANPDRSPRPQSEHLGTKSHNVGAALRFDADRTHRFELGYQHGHEHRRSDLWHYARQGMQLTPVYAYRQTEKISRTHVYVQWDAQWNDAIRSQLRAWRSDLTSKNTYSNQHPGRAAPMDSADKTLDGNVEWRVGDHLLTLGGELREEELLIWFGQFGNRPNKQLIRRGMFIQDEFGITETLSASIGVRRDHHDHMGGKTSPRLYLVWQSTPNLIIKGGIADGFASPSLQQISPDYAFNHFGRGPGTPSHFFILGNPNLKAETSRSLEIGTEWDASEDVKLSAMFFQNRVKNLITSALIHGKTYQGRPVREYQNIGRAKITGLELSLDWRFSPYLIWKNDLTLLRARDTVSSRKLTYRPRQTLNTRLQWELGAWDAELGLRFTGKQVDHYDRTTGNAYTLPSYSMVDLNLGQRINKRISWRLSLENIGNVRLADKDHNFDYDFRGRTLSAMVRAEF